MKLSDKNLLVCIIVGLIISASAMLTAMAGLALVDLTIHFSSAGWLFVRLVGFVSFIAGLIYCACKIE